MAMMRSAPRLIAGLKGAVLRMRPVAVVPAVDLHGREEDAGSRLDARRCSTRISVRSMRHRRRTHEGAFGGAARKITPFDVWRSVATSASASRCPGCDVGSRCGRAAPVRPRSVRSGVVSSRDFGCTECERTAERKVPGPAQPDRVPGTRCRCDRPARHGSRARRARGGRGPCRSRRRARRAPRC